MKILNIYLRNEDANLTDGNYYGIHKKPDEQLYTIYRDNFGKEFTRYLYLSKEYVYRFNIYHTGNKSTFMYKARLYI